VHSGNQVVGQTDRSSLDIRVVQRDAVLVFDREKLASIQYT